MDHSKDLGEHVRRAFSGQQNMIKWKQKGEKLQVKTILIFWEQTHCPCCRTGGPEGEQQLLAAL